MNFCDPWYGIAAASFRDITININSFNSLLKESILVLNPQEIIRNYLLSSIYIDQINSTYVSLFMSMVNMPRFFRCHLWPNSARLIELSVAIVDNRKSCHHEQTNVQIDHFGNTSELKYYNPLSRLEHFLSSFWARSLKCRELQERH